MTGLGLAHAIAHPLGARLGVPHGAALAAVLPAVLRWNQPAVADRLARASSAFGSADAVAAVENLVARLGMARRLGSLGVTPTLATVLANDALADPVIGNTPRMPTLDELRDVIIGLI